MIFYGACMHHDWAEAHCAGAAFFISVTATVRPIALSGAPVEKTMRRPAVTMRYPARMWLPGLLDLH
jgi:hypothetical protein